MAPACNLENISADVALRVTVRSGILSFRRGHKGPSRHSGQPVAVRPTSGRHSEERSDEESLFAFDLSTTDKSRVALRKLGAA